MLASFHESLSYNVRVCLPGSAESTLLECFPTFSGKNLVVPRLDCAALSVVDFILGSCVCESVLGRVASCAFSLAIFLSSLSSLAGIHMIATVFPFLRSFRIAS